MNKWLNEGMNILVYKKTPLNIKHKISKLSKENLNLI